MNILARNNYCQRLRFLVYVGLCLILSSQSLDAQIEGFVEPFHQIELACDESGVVAQLNVKEGDVVKRDEVIAVLDDRTQKLNVKLSAHLAATRSELNAAKRELDKRKTILARIQSLSDAGHAGKSELIRADIEYSIAVSRYESALEAKLEREIEHEQAVLKLKKRRVTAPFDGIVSLVYRKEGEFVSPVKPEIVRLVQLEKVYAVFAIEQSLVNSFSYGKQFEVTIGDQVVVGTVDEIGVQAQAKSNTIKVRMLIDNSNRKLRSGEICTVQL